MTSHQPRPTAKIYMFPSGGRRQLESAKSMAFLPQRAVAECAQDVVYGGSWYHQAAVEEAQASWER